MYKTGVLALPKVGDVILIPYASFSNGEGEDVLKCTVNTVVRTTLFYKYTHSDSGNSCACHKGFCRSWRWSPCLLYYEINNKRVLIST